MSRAFNRFQTLGQFLREKREIAKLSQIEVAVAVGYTSPQFVSNWERGLCSPPLDTLAHLCDILDIPRREIIDIILHETQLELESGFNLRRRRQKDG